MRKKVLKIMSCFFIAIIGFTILSRVIDKKNIAKVETTEVMQNEISHEIMQEARVSYDKESPIFVESDYVVQSILVNEGQEIKEGDALLVFSEDKLKEKQLELKREIEKIDLQIEGIKDQQKINDKRFQQTLDAAEGRVDRVTAAENLNVSQRLEEYTQAEKEYEAYIKNQGTEQYDEEVASGLKKEMNAAKAAYDSAIQTKNDNIAAAKEELKASSISEAEDTTMDQLSIDKKGLQEQLKKIEKLLADSGQVKAQQSGTITQVNLQVGELSPQGAAFLVADESQGVKLEVLVNEEDLKYAAADSSVTITGVNKSGESETRTDCKINNIAAMEGEEDKTYKVVVKIPENSYIVGASVQVNITGHSKVYENCIPIQAIYPENEEEYYIYTVGKKPTMLGETEVAKKVNVTILDRNDTYAAIEETVADEIIIAMNRDINDGDRIRRGQ